MSFTIAWLPRAEKARDKLDATVRERVIAAIERFAGTGHGDVKALKGCPGEFRLRVGDWRVRFTLNPAKTGIVIVYVAHRREVY